MANPLTVGDVARMLGVEDWQVRRVVDRLDVDVPRVGLYRLIPPELIQPIVAGLRERGWFPTTKTSA